MPEKNLVLKLHVEIQRLEGGIAQIQLHHRNTTKELEEIRKNNETTDSDNCLELEIEPSGYAFKRYGNVDVDATICLSRISEQIRHFNPKFTFFCYRIEHLGVYYYQLYISNLPVVGSCAYTAFLPHNKGFLPNLIGEPLELYASPDFENMDGVAEDEEYDEELPNVDNDWDIDYELSEEDEEQE